MIRRPFTIDAPHHLALEYYCSGTGIRSAAAGVLTLLAFLLCLYLLNPPTKLPHYYVPCTFTAPACRAMQHKWSAEPRNLIASTDTKSNPIYQHHQSPNNPLASIAVMFSLCSASSVYCCRACCHAESILLDMPKASALLCTMHSNARYMRLPYSQITAMHKSCLAVLVAHNSTGAHTCETPFKRLTERLNVSSSSQHLQIHQLNNRYASVPVHYSLTGTAEADPSRNISPGTFYLFLYLCYRVHAT